MTTFTTFIDGYARAAAIYQRLVKHACDVGGDHVTEPLRESLIRSADLARSSASLSGAVISAIPQSPQSLPLDQTQRWIEQSSAVSSIVYPARGDAAIAEQLANACLWQIRSIRTQSGVLGYLVEAADAFGDMTSIPADKYEALDRQVTWCYGATLALDQLARAAAKVKGGTFEERCALPGLTLLMTHYAELMKAGMTVPELQHQRLLSQAHPVWQDARVRAGDVIEGGAQPSQPHASDLPSVTTAIWTAMIRLRAATAELLEMPDIQLGSMGRKALEMMAGQLFGAADIFCSAIDQNGITVTLDPRGEPIAADWTQALHLVIAQTVPLQFKGNGGPATPGM